LIEAGQRLGTGFYISSDGDVATASHVLGDRTFTRNPDNQINVNFALPALLYVTNSKGERAEVSARKIENNPDAWLADVARIRTGTKAACWLREVDDHQSTPGTRLLTMGFPGLSFKTLTLYTGIMSARLTTNLPTVILNTGEAVQAPNEFIRVQMPISAGLSGAPIVDDENRVLAVVTNAGGWTRDLENLMLAFHGGAFQVAPPPPNPQQPPNTVTFNLNSFALTAELAGLFHDFASPGYGDAVPLRYLRKPQQQNQPSASHGH
jgi:S1-C subfamily serine protease